MIVSYSNLTLIPWVTGTLLSQWNVILLKRMLCHTSGRQFFWVTSNSFAIVIAFTIRIRDLSIFFNSKLDFHNYFESLFSECVKLFGLIRSIAFSISCWIVYTVRAVLYFSQVKIGIYNSILEFYLFDYVLGDVLIVRTDCVKDLGAMLYSKLHFHRHVDCLSSQALKLLGVISFITYNFSFSDRLKVLHITSTLSKLEYTSVVWNNFTLADSNKLENMKRKFANLCCNWFIQPNSFCNYESMLNYLQFGCTRSRCVEIKK
jgi:hypothetical protein